MCTCVFMALRTRHLLLRTETEQLSCDLWHFPSFQQHFLSYATVVRIWGQLDERKTIRSLSSRAESRFTILLIHQKSGQTSLVIITRKTNNLVIFYDFYKCEIIIKFIQNKQQKCRNVHNKMTAPNKCSLMFSMCDFTQKLTASCSVL